MASEVDNLENLNNADLRAKCKEYGLPNVPITDSSRNVLIRKLRASMTGSPATPKAKINRRETVHVSKTAEVGVAKVSDASKEEAGSRTPSRGANRRTIAGTPTLDKANERPLLTEVAAPINVRRRSVREPEQPQQQQQQKAQNASVDLRPTIIIESDEEDEQDLLQAAVQAAVQAELNVPKAAGGRSRSSRSVSLSKTGVLTTSYNQEVTIPPRIVEEPQPLSEFKKSSYVSSTAVAPTVTGLYPNLLQTGLRNFMTEPVPAAERRAPYTQTSRYTMDATTTRYGGNESQEPISYYSPSARYSTSAATAGAALHSKASALYNEQSDDTEGNADEDFQTPYLSSFARNLERLKAEPIVRSNLLSGGAAELSAARRYTRAKGYEITGRRPAKDSVKESLRQLLIALDRKYHLKVYITMFGIFVLLVFLYVLFFQ